MHAEQRARTRSEFEDRGFSRVVLANPTVVTWLTGIPFYGIPGGTPFSGPPIIWFEHGRFTLIASDIHADRATEFGREDDCDVALYCGYTREKPVTPHRNLADKFGEVAGAVMEEIAAEIRDLPSYLLEFLTGEVISIDGWSTPLRKVKTAEEIEKMRESFRLADVGQYAAKQALEAGASELDVYLAAYDAVVRGAGEIVFVGNDFVSNRRENNIGGPPSDRKLQKGDSIVADISAVWKGYWSDSCATSFVSEPNKEQRRAYDVISLALETGTGMLHPGVRACDIDRAMREIITSAGYAEYPHHGGHGIGITAHEAPRIVDYNEEVLEEGMVVMLEPGTYLPGELAVRLEHGALVTPDGPQLLGASAI